MVGAKLTFYRGLTLKHVPSIITATITVLLLLLPLLLLLD